MSSLRHPPVVLPAPWVDGELSWHVPLSPSPNWTAPDHHHPHLGPAHQPAARQRSHCCPGGITIPQALPSLTLRPACLQPGASRSALEMPRAHHHLESAWPQVTTSCPSPQSMPIDSHTSAPPWPAQLQPLAHQLNPELLGEHRAWAHPHLAQGLLEIQDWNSMTSTWVGR